MEKIALQRGTKLSSLTGMPIYTVDSGRKVGSVKDVIYDSQNNRILAFTLEEPGVISSKRLILPFDKVKSVGRDVVMIETTDVLVPEKNLPEVSNVLNRNKSIKGKRVLTESGNLLGSISDVMIDTDTGQGVSYELSSGLTSDIGRGRSYVPAPETPKVGVDALIVPDEFETRIAEQEPGGLAGAYAGAREWTAEKGQQVSRYTLEQEINLSRGKTAGRDVYDDQGNLIVVQGQEIDDRVIDHAVESGKMHDVALAAGVGGVSAGYERARTGAAGARGTAGTAWSQTKDWASDTWSSLTERSRQAADKASRERAKSAQKEFLKGRVSSTDVRDDQGNIILHEGEIITPLILDNLDRAGKLDMVKLMPEGQPAVGPEDHEEVPEIHVVFESAEQHEQHKHTTD